MDPLAALPPNLRAYAAHASPGGPAATGAFPSQIPAPELAQLQIPGSQTAGLRAATPATFDDVLGRLVSEVNDRQLNAAGKVRNLLGGQEVSLHETMIAMEEASLSFQLMVEVRNKLLESYQELMRMQI
jgi:flagellar hook-basal body complex protein FliE